MSEHDLESIARAIVAPGKGILAADESFPTIKKRFTAINLESTEEARRAYRQMLFTTPGVEEFISGVITFDETLRHASDDGTPFPKLLADKGIIPGIKVDKGAVDLAFHPGEKITEGLDGLRARCEEYYQLGARFTKWRAVITIGEGIPSDYCLQANAEALARYAALSQEAGLVPIVEPEVLMDGGHDLARCEEVTLATLEALYDRLYRAGVNLEGLLLKPNMVISGKKAAVQASTREIAEATIRVLKRVVPPAVPGVVFLSGGQTPAQACENLNMMNEIGGFPWQLSYSYGRALQDEAIRAWGGQAANVEAGQKAFYRRSMMASKARYGEYKPEMEAVPA
jgi:fructose-bisphosphate aldolase class I